MSLIENVRNISYYYIKKHYEKYLNKKGKTILTEEEIVSFTEKIFQKKQDSMIKYIKENIDSLNNKKVNRNELNNLINDIIKDKKLVINRVNYEISQYQKKKQKGM